MKPVMLNLGCGFNKHEQYINVDLYGDPDVTHDLNKAPYPWADNSVDEIQMWHTLEHIDEWWLAFTECARILKPGGLFEIHVPDESSSSALGYRDHRHVFTLHSFHGILDRSGWGTNAWAKQENETIPLILEEYYQVPFKQYDWMTKWCPWLLLFCSKHLRNFIWEQRFLFRKVGDL